MLNSPQISELTVDATCVLKCASPFCDGSRNHTNPVPATVLGLSESHIRCADEFRQRTTGVIENCDPNRHSQPEHEASVTAVLYCDRFP